MHRLLILRASAGVVLLGLITGCGGPKLVPVEGTVTLDGRPLAFKSLFFVPDSGTEGKGAGGFTNSQGRYFLLAVVPGAVTDFRGIYPGRYRVTVYEPLIPITDADFAPMQRQDDGGSSPPPAIALNENPVPSKQPVPTIYSSGQTTPLILEIPDSGGEFNLELSSEPG